MLSYFTVLIASIKFIYTFIRCYFILKHGKWAFTKCFSNEYLVLFVTEDAIANLLWLFRTAPERVSDFMIWF